MYYSRPVARLIEELSKLPGIGPKTAQRLAFYLITTSKETAVNLAEAILEARDKLKFCSLCANITDTDPCGFCRDHTRDPKVICVVEHPRDVVTIEKTHGFKGHYHVLHGCLSPMDGVGPEDLSIDKLLARVKNAPVEEVIVATNADLEGDATALYLAKLLKPLGMRVTRLAYGLPVGSDLEYADGRTLVRALEGRREV
ncbi:MAG: recombination protein RecR [Peptococcaceae bacterium]|nr:recombination protein RecR [Peptococcaceae bacterium]